MKDNTDRDNTPQTSQPDHVLGKLTPGGFDTSLEQTPGAPQISDSSQPIKGLAGLHKGEVRQGDASSAGATTLQRPAQSSNADSDDKLVLPEGALVAMRKSGGFRFTSLQVTVYHNGRVEIEGRTTPGVDAPAPPRKLRDKELAKLYRALEDANLPELPPTSGRQNPDGYAYEIAARLEKTTYNVEAFDSSIPSQLAPLIQVLSGYASAKSAKPKTG